MTLFVIGIGFISLCILGSLADSEYAIDFDGISGFLAHTIFVIFAVGHLVPNFQARNAFLEALPQLCNEDDTTYFA